MNQRDATEPSFAQHADQRSGTVCGSSTTVLLTRVPVPGKVKTRLSSVISPDDCAVLQEAFALDTVQKLSEAGGTLVVCYSDEARDMPEGTAFERRFLEAVAHACDSGCNLRFAPQRGQSLGERMAYAMESAFRTAAGPCILVGSDIPQITAQDVPAAMRALAEHDVVFGPGTDGGYWLVGCRSSFPQLFEGKIYSKADVLAEALAVCHAHGRSVALLHSLFDVDTPADCQTLCERIRVRDPRLGPRTLSLMEMGR